jgi:hypothetical protein
MATKGTSLRSCIEDFSSKTADYKYREQDTHSVHAPSMNKRKRSSSDDPIEPIIQHFKNMKLTDKISGAPRISVRARRFFKNMF